MFPKPRQIECPYCGKVVEVCGSGFYGSYECPYCSTEENQHWFLWSGQKCIPPHEQVMCEDW